MWTSWRSMAFQILASLPSTHGLGAPKAQDHLPRFLMYLWGFSCPPIP
jgi:hypothetical protein